MLKQMLTGKIHKARVTACELEYEGSLGIDRDLLTASGILPYEKILVTNRRNGERIETYAIPAPAGSREFCLNGPAARKGQPGDIIVVMAFSLMEAAEAAEVNPTVIVLDEKNNIVSRRGPAAE